MRAGTDFHTFYKELPPDDRADIDAHSVKLWSPVGSFLCRQGDVSDSVFILEEGVVEVVVETSCDGKQPPIAYLSRGDILGELGVLNNRERSATVRVAADVYYRRIEKADFLRLLREVPAIGLFLCHRLAERVANTTANLAYNSYCVDLSGKLPQFDLLTVLQTIRDSGTTGELKIIGPQKELLGQIFVERGRVEQARFLHLSGREALWQVLLDQIEGAFTFVRGTEPSVPASESQTVGMDISDVLIAAALKRDEFERMPERVRGLQGIVRRAAADLNWDDPETLVAAREVWGLLERESQPLRTVWRRSSHSVAKISGVTQALLDSQQIAWVES